MRVEWRLPNDFDFYLNRHSNRQQAVFTTLQHSQAAHLKCIHDKMLIWANKMYAIEYLQW